VQVVVAVLINGLGIGLMLPTLITWIMAQVNFHQRGRASGCFTAAIFAGEFISPLVVLGITGRCHGAPACVGHRRLAAIAGGGVLSGSAQACADGWSMPMLWSVAPPPAMETERGFFMQALPEFKRVVTGHNAQGQAIIASNGPTPNVFPLLAVPGTVFHELWNSSTSQHCWITPVIPAANPATQPRTAGQCDSCGRTSHRTACRTRSAMKMPRQYLLKLASPTPVRARPTPGTS
jgi:MFS family permease